MNSRQSIRICQQYNEYCQGCPFVNQHGACTIGQPWKQNSTHLGCERKNKSDNKRV